MIFCYIYLFIHLFIYLFIYLFIFCFFNTSFTLNIFQSFSLKNPQNVFYGLLQWEVHLLLLIFQDKMAAHSLFLGYPYFHF